jgi:hypothetical protein
MIEVGSDRFLVSRGINDVVERELGAQIIELVVWSAEEVPDYFCGLILYFRGRRGILSPLASHEAGREGHQTEKNFPSIHTDMRRSGIKSDL